jgi:hypothetical protein
MSTYYEFPTIEKATAFAKEVKFCFMLDSQILDKLEEFPPTVCVDNPMWQALLPGWQPMWWPSAKKKELPEWQQALLPSTRRKKKKWWKLEKQLQKLEDRTWEKVDELALRFGGENTGT